MKVSDVIEKFLLDMLEEDPDIMLKRNELASHFSCAPSQINYVIETRFTDQRGYIVESRRGGGGFIRIRKVLVDKSNYLMHVINSIGDSLSFHTALVMLENMADAGIITEREKNLMAVALSDKYICLDRAEFDKRRARIFKNMLLTLV